MTPNEIISAYRAVQELSGVVFPYKLARDIARLKTRLSEEFDVVLNVEQALVKSHGGKSKGGRYDFPSSAAKAAFAREYEELMNQNDSAISLPAVDISKYVDTLRISPDAIAALDGIVIFEEV